MATGHILPGYGEPVTKLKRAKTAFPLDKTTLKEYALYHIPAPSGRELTFIRENARNMWTSGGKYATSYNSHYTGQKLDEPTKLRPTSPTRLNKPHPPLVFLTNRLHYIEGYQNPDLTIGKPCYRVDGITHGDEQFRRAQYRSKYESRPRTAALNQYVDNGLRDFYPATEAQAAEAWLKIANDKDKYQLGNAIEEEKMRQRELQARQQKFEMATGVPPMLERSNTMPVASHHRWMKMAGVEESRKVQDIYQSLERPMSRASGGSVLERRQLDVQGVGQSRAYTPAKLTRGDFLMHPDWPPNIPHHRVP